MLHILIPAVSSIALPPELNSKKRVVTSHLGLPSFQSHLSGGVNATSLRHFRVSPALDRFLTSYTRQPLKIVFSTFQNFFKTPIVLRTYVPPDLEDITYSGIVPLLPVNRGNYTIKLCRFLDNVWGGLETWIPLRRLGEHGQPPSAERAAAGQRLPLHRLLVDWSRWLNFL
jgi:hypothetical protein